MASLLLSPDWFFGYSILLELLFGIITFSVSYYAWKVYKVTEERNIRLFSLAFIFVALSYFARALLNFIIYYKFDDAITGMINLRDIYLLKLFGVYIYSILFLIGILLLAYIALKIYSLRTFVLLFLLVFTSLYFTPFKTFMLYLLTTVLLGFIVYYYFGNYFNNKKTNTLLVLISMMLLFAAYISFMVSMYNPIYYFIGHILEVAAYLIILTNLILLSRFDKKITQTNKQKNGKKTR